MPLRRKVLRAHDAGGRPWGTPDAIAACRDSGAAAPKELAPPAVAVAIAGRLLGVIEAGHSPREFGIAPFLFGHPVAQVLHLEREGFLALITKCDQSGEAIEPLVQAFEERLAGAALEELAERGFHDGRLGGPWLGRQGGQPLD